jgi:hypothetical protein
MISEHPFWFCLTAVCIVWYSSITVYVAFKGYMDIKHMLENLKNNHANENVEKLTAIK